MDWEIVGVLNVQMCKVIYENKEIGYNSEAYVTAKEFTAPYNTIYLNHILFDKLMCAIYIF